MAGTTAAIVAIRDVIGDSLSTDTIDYIAGMLEDDESIWSTANTAAIEALIGPFLSDVGLDVPSTCIKLCEALTGVNDAKNGHGSGGGGSGRDSGDRGESNNLTTIAVDDSAVALANVLPRKPVCPSAFLDNTEFVDPYLGLQKMNVNFNQQIPIGEAVKLQYTQQRERDKQLRMMREWERSKAAVPTPVKQHGNTGRDKMTDVIVHSFSVSVAGRELLKDAQLKIIVGRKYGLIGRNGIGKSTFIGALVRKEIPGLQRDLSVSCVEQELHEKQMLITPLEAVLAVDAERTELLEREAKLLQKQKVSDLSEEEETANGKELAKIYIRMTEIDSDSAPAQAASILAGLGFTEAMQNKKVQELSGGWRVRVALARALFSAPDILCLDEPTNHLDLHAVAWLTSYLRTWPTSCIIVSHSRNFLNDVCSDIIDFKDQKLKYYKGDYDIYERTKEECERLQQRRFEAQQQHREHIQSFIDKFRANAKRATLVQSRVKALEKLPLLEAVKEDPSLVFHFESPEPLPTPILQLNGCWYSYVDKSGRDEDDWTLKDVDLNIDFDSRIAICGVNGSGKSTLLKLLAGQLEPQRGFVRRHNRLRVGVFSQHHVDQLDLTLNAVQALQQTYPNEDMKPEAARAYLGRFGITGLLALEPLYILSGGQKSRVAIAVMAYVKPHILLLDEPTNHLDLDAVQALIAALNEFDGGVVVVSHDVHLLSCSVDQVLYVSADTHRLVQFNGDIMEYKNELLKKKIN